MLVPYLDCLSFAGSPSGAKLKSHVMDACVAILVDVVGHARKGEQCEAMAGGVVGQKSVNRINVLGFSPTTVPYQSNHLSEPRGLQIDVMKRWVEHPSSPMNLYDSRSQDPRARGAAKNIRTGARGLTERNRSHCAHQ
jgi:hypothetical protein